MARSRPIFPSTLVTFVLCATALGSQRLSRSAEAQKSPPILSAQEVFGRDSPSVMVVESLDAGGKVTAFGSGVVIAHGFVVTNRHVVEKAVSVQAEHGSKKWTARVSKVDPDHDLAELSVPGLAAPAVQIRDSSTLAVGETVYAIGAPEGLELTISEGLVSGLRDFDKTRVIQTSAAISPGSSGGGLFDAKGQLVGITTSYLKDGQNLNFALPAEWALALSIRPANASPPGNENGPDFLAILSGELAYDLTKSGEYEMAIRAGQKAVALKPDYESAWVNLGVAYVMLQNYADALGAQKNAIRLRPDDAKAWAGLGLAYDMLDQNVEAAKAYEEAVKLEPDNALYWYSLGLTCQRLGLFDKAMHAHENAVSLKPDYVDAWFRLGALYRMAGEQSKVIRVYEKLKALDSDQAEKFFRLFVLPSH
jgi:cytochrome c-type biogenesis protein CcmH/NrfG